MALPEEIVPGLFHWTAPHPEIHIRVHSYYLAAARMFIDPLLPSPGGEAWLAEHGPPEHIVLTNRLHSRHSTQLVAAFGCTVCCPREGLFQMAPELDARPYAAGDVLPGDARAFEVGVLCPDESALLLPAVGALAVADGVVRDEDGPLSFVPDGLLADDPAEVGRIQRGLKTAYLRLAGEEFRHLLMAHGNPWLHEGRAALRAWAEA